MAEIYSASYSDLEILREECVPPYCPGLTRSRLEPFLKSDPLLRRAILEARERLPQLKKRFPSYLRGKSEEELRDLLTEDFLSFYPRETSSPYVPLAAKGPWVITLGGAVIYDTGGYGMLGQGHDPDCVRASMSEPQVMANIMTPSLYQAEFSRKLFARIGGSGACPYERILCMNSGTEGMAVALRISDGRAKKLTDPGGDKQGKTIKIVSLVGSFHGRTLRPALISDSTRARYLELASFQKNIERHETIRVNDAAHAEEVFQRLEEQNIFIEAIAIEPVMGEGRPGTAITREFYDVVRSLSRKHGALLIADSIQAGLRAQGVLSIVDYPGFEGCDPPDMEIFSKALNAGQYPLSVVALAPGIADFYVPGTYGNTMTANPRALEVGSRVLDAVSDSLTENIRARGKEFREKLEELQKRHPKVIDQVTGTGLLIAAELNPEMAQVVGRDGIEQRLRRRGINVIHGGKNALRFTPWFLLSSLEIELVCSLTEEVLVDSIEQR